MEKELIKYIQIIKDFTNGIIPIEEFESNYLNMVKNETFIFDKDNSKIIETLFSDVDSYCGDAEIANYDANDPFADIDESELRNRARMALELLIKRNP